MLLSPNTIRDRFRELEAERASCKTARERIAVDLKILELQDNCPHKEPHRHDHKNREGKCIGHYCDCCGKGWSTIVP